MNESLETQLTELMGLAPRIAVQSTHGGHCRKTRRESATTSPSVNTDASVFAYGLLRHSVPGMIWKCRSKSTMVRERQRSLRLTPDRLRVARERISTGIETLHRHLRMGDGTQFKATYRGTTWPRPLKHPPGRPRRITPRQCNATGVLRCKGPFTCWNGEVQFTFLAKGIDPWLLVLHTEPKAFKQKQNIALVRLDSISACQLKTRVWKAINSILSRK